MTNHRSLCHYCKTSVLTRDVGAHIFRNHEETLFTNDNLKGLHRDRYFKQPLEIFIDTDTYYVCLADNSCIKKSILADKHFKGKEDQHKEKILSLRLKYPLTAAAAAAPAAPETSTGEITSKDKIFLENFIVEMLMAIKGYEKNLDPEELVAFSIDRKQLATFNKMGIQLDDDSLKSKYPAIFGEQKEKVEEPKEEEEDLLDFVNEKSLTQEETIKELMTEKDLEKLSVGMVSGKNYVIPEIEKYRNIIQNKKPLPIEKKAPEPSLEKPQDKSEEYLQIQKDIEDWKRLTPWERFSKQNEGMSVGELIMAASQSGIQPDKGANMKIVCNTKRQPKKTDV